EHRDRMGERRVVLAHRAVRVDRLDLGDHVELAAPVALQHHMTSGLEPGPEAAAALADPPGDGAHLAVALGHERDDAVGLAELDRAQDDTLIAVEARDAVESTDAGTRVRGGPARRQVPSTPPKRRSRDWYSRTASKRCSLRKSGQSTSVKTNSEYALSHSR